jgi:hypothetical protein
MLIARIDANWCELGRNANCAKWVLKNESEIRIMPTETVKYKLQNNKFWKRNVNLCEMRSEKVDWELSWGDGGGFRGGGNHIAPHEEPYKSRQIHYDVYIMM